MTSPSRCSALASWATAWWTCGSKSVPTRFDRRDAALAQQVEHLPVDQLDALCGTRPRRSPAGACSARSRLSTIGSRSSTALGDRGIGQLAPLAVDALAVVVELGGQCAAAGPAARPSRAGAPPVGIRVAAGSAAASADRLPTSSAASAVVDRSMVFVVDGFGHGVVQLSASTNCVAQHARDRLRGAVHQRDRARVVHARRPDHADRADASCRRQRWRRSG